MPPRVDLVILLSAGVPYVNKAEFKETIQEAEEQYTRLLNLLRTSRLRAVGKRGEKPGDLMILVGCSLERLDQLARAERLLNFFDQVSVTDDSIAEGNVSLSGADRVRLVHDYVASANRGSLAVIPRTEQWSCVTDIIVIHDQGFSERWIRESSSHGVGPLDFDKIKDHFGEEVGLYFHFLTTYTKALAVISALGCVLWLFGASYNPYYTTTLILWANGFVDYWEIVERKISIRWGAYGAYRIEEERHDYVHCGDYLDEHLRRAARIAESIPVVLGSAAALAGILTTLFAIEGLITRLYTGPFHQHVDLLKGFLSTILFLASVPSFLRVWKSFATQLTNREKHQWQSTYRCSLAIKRFALPAIVVSLGFVLSLLVYAPSEHQLITSELSETVEATKDAVPMGIWERASAGAAACINTTRLQDHVYAYTVMFGLPHIMRLLGRGRGGATAIRKRADFQDEKSGEGESSATSGEERKEERELLAWIRREVTLGKEHDMFERYLEIVTQFCYVVICSAIWPLAPVVALLNNYVELRFDPFIGPKYLRRPVPVRTDSIGPWLTCLWTLLWIAAPVNSVLVYKFNLRYLGTTPAARQWAYSYALINLDVFLIGRWVVWFVVERVFWRGSEEEMKSEELKRKAGDLDRLDPILDARLRGPDSAEDEDADDFWKQDEGPLKDA